MTSAAGTITAAPANVTVLTIARVPVAKPPSPARVLASWMMSLTALCAVVFIVNVTLISQFQHYTAQNTLYEQLRQSLAEGSIPIGQTDVDGNLTAPGTPVAMLSIPALGVDEVVVEGTSAAQTKLGVGHRRDTPLPGQPGVSVLMGRAAGWGGVFRHLDRLEPGDVISITMGQGVAEYRVLGVRSDGTLLPVLGAQDGRLTLVSARGTAFIPEGVIRVDAELVSQAFPRPPPVIAAGGIPPGEGVLVGDTSGVFALPWLVQLLAGMAVLAVVSWKRWGPAATWLVFTPILAATGLTVADNVSLLLPNLL